MLKKFGLLLLTISLFAILSAVLVAQTPTAPPLSQSDVDLYIKICSESDPTAKAKILSDASGSDPVGVGMNQGKIGSVASLLMAGQDANAIKASLGAIPNFTITDDEIKFLIDQKDALVAATKAAANIQ